MGSSSPKLAKVNSGPAFNMTIAGNGHGGCCQALQASSKARRIALEPLHTRGRIGPKGRRAAPPADGRGPKDTSTRYYHTSTMYIIQVVLQADVNAVIPSRQPSLAEDGGGDMRAGARMDCR